MNNYCQQVLAYRHHVSDRQEVRGDGRPRRCRRAARLLQHHRAGRPLHPRRHCAAAHLLRCHAEESLHIHLRDAEGHPDGVGHGLQVRRAVLATLRHQWQRWFWLAFLCLFLFPPILFTFVEMRLNE